MDDLRNEDREALLLRFFKDRDFRAIGAALGISDDAAQKRVNRALERLRARLASRGVTSTAGALAVLLAADALSLAPAGLTLISPSGSGGGPGEPAGLKYSSRRLSGFGGAQVQSGF